MSETNYDYVLENEQTSIKISKKVWEQVKHSRPGVAFNDGLATVIFYKTIGGTRIQKTFKDKKIVMVVDDIAWRYIWNWILHPEKRDELTAEYIKSMRPEEIKKRNIENFRAQFESEEYKKGLQEAYDKIQDYQTPPQDEKELTRAMVDSWSFEELKNKLRKEGYKPQLYSSKNESAFSGAWRQSHYRIVKGTNGKKVDWDTISPYAYDYQIVWDIKMGHIQDKKFDFESPEYKTAVFGKDYEKKRAEISRIIQSEPKKIITPAEMDVSDVPFYEG